MRILLDTHTFIWFAFNAKELPIATRELLEDAASELYFSYVSVWEMVIKVSIGKMSFSTRVVDLVTKQADRIAVCVFGRVNDLDPRHELLPLIPAQIASKRNFSGSYSRLLVDADKVAETISARDLWRRKRLATIQVLRATPLPAARRGWRSFASCFPALRSIAGLRSRQLLPYLRPYRGVIVWAVVALLVASGAMLVLPVALKDLLDHGMSAANAERVNGYFLFFLGAAVVFGVFAALRYYLVTWLGERVVADLRTAVYARVVRMDPTFFEVTRTGEVLSRLTADTTLVQSITGANLSFTLRSLVNLCGALVMLWFTSARLMGVIVVLIPLVVAPLVIYGRRVRGLSRAAQDRVADTSSLVDETLNAIQTVQAFTLESLQSERYRAAVEDSFGAANRRNRTRATLTALGTMLVFAGITTVLWLGARAVMVDLLTVDVAFEHHHERRLGVDARFEPAFADELVADEFDLPNFLHLAFVNYKDDAVVGGFVALQNADLHVVVAAAMVRVAVNEEVAAPHGVLVHEAQGLGPLRKARQRCAGEVAGHRRGRLHFERAGTGSVVRVLAVRIGERKA